MAFINDQSCKCLKSELDLFSVHPTQTSIVNGNWIEYHPLNTVGDGSPIEFDINGTGEDYIDLANTMLFVRAKIIRPDGTNITNDTPIGPTNLWILSIFASRYLSEWYPGNHFNEYISLSGYDGNTSQLWC